MCSIHDYIPFNKYDLLFVFAVVLTALVHNEFCKHSLIYKAFHHLIRIYFKISVTSLSLYPYLLIAKSINIEK